MAEILSKTETINTHQLEQGEFRPARQKYSQNKVLQEIPENMGFNEVKTTRDDDTETKENEELGEVMSLLNNKQKSGENEDDEFDFETPAPKLQKGKLDLNDRRSFSKPKVIF